MSAHAESLATRPLPALIPAPLGFVRYQDRPRRLLVMCGLGKIFNKPKGLKEMLPGMHALP